MFAIGQCIILKSTPITAIAANKLPKVILILLAKVFSELKVFTVCKGIKPKAKRIILNVIINAAPG